MPGTPWVPRRSPPALVVGTVDVWRADLRAAGAHERAFLDVGERERAARLVRPGDGERWAAARGILRALLGACLGADPRALRFAAGPHGKPRLDGAPDVRFNLSHAGDVALYAVTRGREVGVDVELPRARPADLVAIARRALGEAQADRLAQLDPPRREQAFLLAWTAWEAALKCRGTGIGAAEGAPAGPEPWLQRLDPGPPAAAALAVERGPCTVRCWQWPAVGD